MDWDDYDSADVRGGSGVDYVGGLVGVQIDGRIVASYTRGDNNGKSGIGNFVGGLVGQKSGGVIVSSYSFSHSHGRSSTLGNSRFCMGGLVGQQIDGRIIASYARGDISYAEGSSIASGAGGFIGCQNNGQIFSSYATGDSDGTGGSSDRVAGFIGYLQGGSVNYSYAAGDSDGEGGTDYVGRFLAEYVFESALVSSYGFGSTQGENVSSRGTPPNGVNSPSDLTPSNSGRSAFSRWPLSVWDFGDSSQAAALKYVDDYEGGNYICTSTMAFLPPIEITCGTTLLPGQGR